MQLSNQLCVSSIILKIMQLQVEHDFYCGMDVGVQWTG